MEYRLKGNYKTYMSQLQEAVKRLPSDNDLRLELARVYRKVGDLDRALEEFLIVLEREPNRKALYNDLGYVFAERGDFHTALKYIDKYQESAPDEPNPYDSKGEILMQAGRFDEAARELKTALAKWPQFFHSAKRLSDIAVERADFKSALKYLDQALAVAPGGHIKYSLRINQAIIYWRFGKFDQALSLMDELIKENPTASYTILAAAEMYHSMGNSQKAAEVQLEAFKQFTKDLAAKKDDIHYLDNFIWFSFVADLPPQEVISALQKVRSQLDNGDLNRILHFSLALAYIRNGQSEKALPILQENAAELTELLAIERYQGWSIWKYVFEAIDHEAVNDPNQISCISHLMDIVRDTGREDLRIISGFARARYYGRRGNVEALAAEYQNLGAPLDEKWQVIGPFSTEKVSGFEYPFPPEKEIDINATYLSGKREVKWQPAGDGFFDGYTNLRALLKHSSWSVGYGLTYVHSPEKRKVQIRLGCDEGGRLWLNNELIWQRYIKRDAAIDRDLVTVVLRPGHNKLLLKVTNTDFDWGYYLRITDENGRGFQDITFHSPAELDQPLSIR
jgi:tetratricopeptide (TPR) repeat protein